MMNQGFKLALLLSSFFLSLCLSEDLIMGENSCRLLFDEHDRAAMFSRNFIGGQSNRWPNGIVPFTISSNFTESQKKVILDAMKHIMDRSCVKFVQRTNEINYVDIFTGGRGCYANLGYNQYRQRSVVHLQSGGCVYLGTVAHELLHILGFNHEQTRFDRDEYVTIEWANIKDGTQSNFWRVMGENEGTTLPICRNVGIDQYDSCTTGYRASTFGKPYDYGSVMHYGLSFFTKNGLKTMTLKKPTTLQVPNRNGMSSLDAEKTRAAYNCQEATAAPTTSTEAPTTTPEAPTPTEEPITQGSTSEEPTTVPPTTITQGCTDTSEYCTRLVRMCGTSPFVNIHCPKTCFNCNCKDELKKESCDMLKDHCRANFIRKLCHKTCGSCDLL